MPASKAERNRQKAPAVARYQAKTYGKYTFRYKLSGEDGVTMDEVRRAAEAAGMSVNAWIIEAIKEKL